MVSARAVFRFIYGSFYFVLCTLLVCLLLITPGDTIYQAYENKQLYNIWFLGACLVGILLVVSFIYALRLYNNKTILASIPKSWVPIEKGDVPKRVFKMITEGLDRSAVIQFESRPRFMPDVLDDAQSAVSQLSEKREEGAKKELQLLKLRKKEAVEEELGVAVPPRRPVWGEIEHRGWASPESPDLSDLQYSTVLSELPNLIEAKALTLAPPIPESTAEPPMLDPDAMALLERPFNLGLRQYLNHLSELGVVPMDGSTTEFLTMYEYSRFSNRPLTNSQFRDVMQLFALLLRSMGPFDPAILDDSIDEEDEDARDDAMRLLHAKTLELGYFMGKAPPYAILSHTWGEDEFIFEDFQKDFQAQLAAPKRGLRKVLDTCKRALQDGFNYVWVDTCCIDKTSSAELSEAINSMYEWYQKAEICYILLEDVRLEKDGTFTNFDGARWFTRGWTLQELMAPKKAQFFDMEWKLMSERRSLAAQISKITSVDESLLRMSYYNVVEKSSVATVMSWAAKRQTTRVEDAAYCLMGIFGVNMPLLYGEGQGAFKRLQEHVLVKFPMDQTILAWRASTFSTGALTWDVRDFTSYDGVRLRLRPIPSFQFQNEGMKGTPSGVEVEVLLVPFKEEDVNEGLEKKTVAILNCFFDDQPLHRVGILVEKPPGTTERDNVYMRSTDAGMMVVCPPGEARPLSTPRLQFSEAFASAPKKVSGFPSLLGGMDFQVPQYRYLGSEEAQNAQKARAIRQLAEERKHMPKPLDMDKQRTARILLLSSSATRSIEAQRLGWGTAMSNTSEYMSNRPLSLYIDGSPSFEFKASYPEPRANDVGRIVHQVLPRIPRGRLLQHKYTLGPFSIVEGQEQEKMAVQGIMYFERTAGLSFFIMWATRPATSRTSSFAPAHCHCAILEWEQLVGVEEKAKDESQQGPVAQDSASLKATLSLYMQRQLAAKDYKSLGFGKIATRNEKLGVWAEFRETDFLGMKDTRLYVGELDVSGN
ncbi:hypothetical protein ACHAQA_003645 [Verticillium albo-atrum]